ncbi:MAG: shikimate kinase [Acidobacteriota bacterium]|nr:shikimate kinase [Acidobacteriota bacterium]
MHIKLKRAPGIYLAGFMGSGKSTVGRILADRLGWDFIDVDREIEAKEKESIATIFETRGEAEFRRIETAALADHVRRVERGLPCVFALGGGAFVQLENFELIKNHGISIWLCCSFDAVQDRLSKDNTVRPLAQDPVRFRQLFDERQEGYSRADFRVEGDCETGRTVEAILDLPLWK